MLLEYTYLIERGDAGLIADEGDHLRNEIPEECEK